MYCQRWIWSSCLLFYKEKRSVVQFGCAMDLFLEKRKTGIKAMSFKIVDCTTII